MALKCEGKVVNTNYQLVAAKRQSLGFSVDKAVGGEGEYVEVVCERIERVERQFGDVVLRDSLACLAVISRFDVFQNAREQVVAELHVVRNPAPCGDEVCPRLAARGRVDPDTGEGLGREEELAGRIEVSYEAFWAAAATGMEGPKGQDPVLRGSVRSTTARPRRGSPRFGTPLPMNSTAGDLPWLALKPWEGTGDTARRTLRRPPDFLLCTAWRGRVKRVQQGQDAVQLIHVSSDS